MLVPAPTARDALLHMNDDASGATARTRAYNGRNGWACSGLQAQQKTGLIIENLNESIQIN